MAVGRKKSITPRGVTSMHWSSLCPPCVQDSQLQIWYNKWVKLTAHKEKCLLFGKEETFNMYEENSQHFIINDIL